MTRRLALLAVGFIVACRRDLPPVTAIDEAAGTFTLTRLVDGTFPQQLAASATDTTYLLGGSLVVVGTNEFRLIDSLRVAHRGTTGWESYVFNNQRVGFGSLVGNAVQLTWEGGGKGDLIVFDSINDLIVYRGTYVGIYQRRR